MSEPIDRREVRQGAWDQRYVSESVISRSPLAEFKSYNEDMARYSAWTERIAVACGLGLPAGDTSKVDEAPFTIGDNGSL
jgi:hypothetical protein